MKSGNLNFLEPSGALQACNGTALPLTQLTLYLQGVVFFLKISQLLKKSRNFLFFLTPESHRPAHEIPRMIP